MAEPGVIAAVFLQIIYFSTVILAFNLDTRVPIIKKGPTNSYFGFSVAQHQMRSRNTNKITQLFLVGAPRANITDSTASPSVRRLVNPGVLYSCPVTSSINDCESVKIDRDPPKASIGKDNQWFGVAVRSQGTPDGKAVVCAHRQELKGLTFRWGLGVCMSTLNSLDLDRYLEPCAELPRENGHHQYGVCQSGTSIAIHEDGDVLVGAPGPFNWRGELFKNTIIDDITADASWFGTKNDVDSFSYLGMSTSVAKVIDGRTSYIGGAPRSMNSGQVLMFTAPTRGKKMDLHSNRTLTGEQFGSLFGHEVLAVDINDDGSEDLIVGAPFYHKAGFGGAIYVYMNSKQGILKETKPIRIESRVMPEKECKQLNCENARFGFSLANLRDVDQDGYPDIAVGAPYEGNGAVYIFRGSKNGLIKEYAQRIVAGDLPTARPLKTFGYSLSGGIDMDNNGYPDMVVGAYDSNKVLVLRSRPVINTESHLLSKPGIIDPKQTVCLKNGKQNNCFDIRVCFKFTAEPQALFTETLDLDYTIEAEKFTGKSLSRVFFKRGKPDAQHKIEGSIQLHEQSKNQFKCTEHLVYIIKNNRDFLNPIMFHLSYKLKERPPPTMLPGGPVPSLNAYPVLNEKAAQRDLAVEFKKSCGLDQKCISDLTVGGSFDLPTDNEGTTILSLGEVKELKLDLMVTNRGEDAHETILTVNLPESLSYTGITTDQKQQYSCSPKRDTNQVMCYIGNPFGHNQTARFTMRLDPSRIQPKLDHLDISLRVNTTSIEKNDHDDYHYLYVKVVIRTDMLVRGYSEPPELFYGGAVIGESAIKYEDQIGGGVIHSYEVKNNGPGKVSNSTVFVYWPYEVENSTPQGKHLLYIMQEPEVDSPGKCIIEPGVVNPLGIKPKSRIEVSVPDDKNNTYDSNVVKYRRRREAIILSEEEEEPSTGRKFDVVNMNCDRGSAKCHKIKCMVGEMRRGESIVIKIRARLWNSTLVEDYSNVDFVRIKSKAVLIIDPTLNIKQDNVDNDVASATTKAIPDLKIQPAKGVPKWVIALAVVGGLLLLALLILLLWKCGFFKRKKVDETMGLYEGKVEKKKKYNYEESDYS